MPTFEELDRILRQEEEPGPADAERLFSATIATPLHRVLFRNGAGDHALLAARLVAWRRLAIAIDRHAAEARPGTLSPFELWSYPLALAQSLAARRIRVVGIAGPAGCGKTTLAALLVDALRALDLERPVARVSLDDFYLPQAERRRLGLPWRAMPGSHDLGRAVRLLEEVHAGRSAIEVPTFDPSRDEPAGARRIAGPLSLLLFEGWIVGMPGEEYGPLRGLLDLLLYLDVPLALARERRFGREADLRRATGGEGGLSVARMESFWREVLEPGAEAWVRPIEESADLVLVFDERGALREARERKLDRGG